MYRARAILLNSVIFAALLQCLHYKVPMSNNVIRHDGVVKSIDGQHVRVTILQASACGGCAARAMCSSAEAKEKEVDVITSNASAFSIGQTVTLEGRISDARWATLWAYGLPLAVVLVVLLVSYSVTDNDILAGRDALIALCLYYGGLYVFARKSLNKKFSFTINAVAN